MLLDRARFPTRRNQKIMKGAGEPGQTTGSARGRGIAYTARPLFSPARRAIPSMSSNPLNGATFVLAAHEIVQLPFDQGAEVAFAGRSNAGKSSALTALTGHNALARTSKTPGRTQLMVVFDLPRLKVEGAEPLDSRLV